jgi:hypothetical protein
MAWRHHPNVFVAMLPAAPLIDFDLNQRFKAFLSSAAKKIPSER